MICQKLEEKVNKLLSIHELDSVLTTDEKALVEEVRDDIKNKRKGNFTSVDSI